MRILEVIPYYSPRLGGSPQVVYQISRELAGRGHKVTVIAGNFGLKDSTFPETNANKVILRSVVSRWGFYFTPGLIPWMYRHRKDFDIIHLHEVRTFQNLIVRWFAVRDRIPYVLSAHGTLPIIVQRQFLKRAFDWLGGKAILLSARFLIAVSSVEADQYVQAGIENSRIRLLYNGLDPDEFSMLPPSGEFREKIPGLDGKTRIILYLGRLHKQKGINILIEAIQLLDTDPDKVLLVIAGPDDGELARLQALAEKLFLKEKIYFAGPLYGRGKLAAMVDADVLVSPAVYEIFGLVPFEALMCGTPVIVADDTGLGQIMRQSGAGYLFPMGNVDALASTIRQVLLNPEEAQQKVRIGKSFITDHLDWKKIAGELEKVYQMAVDKQGHEKR